MRDFYEVVKSVVAITGQRQDTIFPKYNKSFLLGRVNNALDKVGRDDIALPSWYQSMSIDEAICHELYGVGCLAEWFYYDDSSQIYTVGENVFIVRDGHDKLMKQRVSQELRAILSRISDGEEIADGVVFYRTANGEYLMEKTVSVTTTKQDIALSIFSLLSGNTNVKVTPSIFKRVSMRKTNSMEVELLDGRQFKIIIKNIGEED